MTDGMRAGRFTLGSIVILSTLFGGVALAEPTEPEAPRATMQAVFHEIKVLIPLSFDEQRWQDPEVRKKTLASLDRLERLASLLERHGRERPAGFSELAINLGGDFNEARERYLRGEFEEARFFLTGALQNCVSCHSRLPSERSGPLANELMDTTEVKSLTLRDRAWLFVAVRRFDDALDAWESLIGNPALPIAQLDAGGVLVDYLNVAIRVRRDIARVSRTLEAMASRDDLPFYLSRRVGEWRAATKDLQARNFETATTPSLETGVALAKKAGSIADGPFGRDGLVQDLAAASHLVQWLEQDRARRATLTRNPSPQERTDTATAYYWLGVVEARSLDGFWVNLSERHLEAAIRSDPHGPIAASAYSALEETQILGYGGATGSELPTDVWNRLNELRELMGMSG